MRGRKVASEQAPAFVPMMRSVAKGRGSPEGVSATARFAYWVDTGMAGAGGSLTLMRAPLDGSAGAEVVAPVNEGPTDTVVAGDTLYFNHDGALATLASDASVPTDLVPDALPLRLASDADYIYWTACGGIERVARGGGSVQQLDDMSCSMALATDGTDVYFVDWEDPPAPPRARRRWDGERRGLRRDNRYPPRDGRQLRLLRDRGRPVSNRPRGRKSRATCRRRNLGHRRRRRVRLLGGFDAARHLRPA